jgi:hypothetical protein
VDARASFEGFIFHMGTVHCFSEWVEAGELETESFLRQLNELHVRILAFLSESFDVFDFKYTDNPKTLVT